MWSGIGCRSRSRPRSSTTSAGRSIASRRNRPASIRPVPVLTSRLDPGAEQTHRNRAHMQGLVADLRDRLARARVGGPDRARERHVAAGKLLPRERVERLLDLGTAFLEIAPLAADGLYDGEAPGAGLITGVG